MAFRNVQAGMATYRGQGGDRGDAYYAHPTNAGPIPALVGYDRAALTQAICRQ
jgi:hypothetical protein